MAKYKTTPKGTAVYPRLTHPDTKYNSDGEYKCDLELEGDDAVKVRKYIDKLVKEAVAQAKEDGVKASVLKKKTNYPYEVVEDEDGDETGAIRFRFKLKAKGKSRDGEEFTQRPALFDASGTPINPKNINVYSGSQIKVSFDHTLYGNNAIGAGVSLRLRGVQIIELVEGNGGGNAEKFGFGEEEGYSANDFDDEEIDNEEADGADDEPEEDEDF